MRLNQAGKIIIIAAKFPWYEATIINKKQLQMATQLYLIDYTHKHFWLII